MIIRKAEKKDFEDYFKFNKIFNKEMDSYEFNIFKGLDKKVSQKRFLKRIKHKNWLILVAEDKKKLIGFFEGEIEDKNQKGYKFKIRYIGYVNNVFVKNGWRKKEIFTKFQLEFERYLKSKEIKHCCLHVNSINVSALKSYEKMNFKIDEYKMLKVLR